MTVYQSSGSEALEYVTIFENEIIDNKTLEHASPIFPEPWALANEIMLNIMG